MLLNPTRVPAGGARQWRRYAPAFEFMPIPKWRSTFAWDRASCRPLDIRARSTRNARNVHWPENPIDQIRSADGASTQETSREIRLRKPRESRQMPPTSVPRRSLSKHSDELPLLIWYSPCSCIAMHLRHREAAKQHELAGQGHRTASKHSGTGDNPSGNWYDERALQYSDHAYELAIGAHNKSGQLARF